MFSFKMKGFDELRRSFDQLRRKAEALDGENKVSFSELFPDTFIRKNTRFATLQDLFNASGFSIQSQEDFENVPEETWDKFIKANTNFSSWENMKEAAIGEWFAKKLGLR